MWVLTFLKSVGLQMEPLADLRVRVQPATASRYAQRLEAFEVWLRDQEVPPLEGLIENVPVLDLLLTAYVQSLYDGNRPLTWARAQSLFESMDGV